MADELRVWVVDDDQSVRWVLEQALKQAEQKVQLLMEQNGELITTPFTGEEEDG